MIQDIKDYFYNLHDNVVNQKYNKTLPYSFHLEMVYLQGKKFEKLIFPVVAKLYDVEIMSLSQELTVGLYGHDSIEDARLTYNDIKDQYGAIAAEIIYLCTEDKGRSRADRKSDKWYEELKTNELAVFVKLCDIIANVKFSLLTNSSMFNKYKSEYEQKVKPHLYSEQYKDMFDYLDKLFTL